jgi:hypothetical protein
MIVNSTAVSPRKTGQNAKGTSQDSSTQTTLTFLPILPKEVEEVLKKYCVFNEVFGCTKLLRSST